jgi:hypothetical protein
MFGFNKMYPPQLKIICPPKKKKKNVAGTHQWFIEVCMHPNKCLDFLKKLK